MTPAKAKVIFASHMQAARSRKLSTYERNQLSIARQTLRQSRKSAMNPSYYPEGKYIAYIIKNDDYKRVAVNQSTREKAIRDAIAHSKRHGESWLYEEQALIGHFIDGLNVLGGHKTSGPSAPQNPRRAKRNPNGVLIYGEVQTIYAKKTQNHLCDADCKAHGHRYYHKFSSKPKMYGLPDGTILIKP